LMHIKLLYTDLSNSKLRNINISALHRKGELVMKLKTGKIRKVILNKQFVITALALVVVVAGVVNWQMNENGDFIPTSATDIEYEQYENEDNIYGDSVEAGAESDFFAQQRVENESSKTKELEINKEILNNNNSSQEAKNKAEQEISRIAKSIESENSAESLIKAKGYDDALVMVGAETVAVIVKTEKLEAQDVAVIKDIVVGQTGYTADKIKISEMK